MTTTTGDRRTIPFVDTEISFYDSEDPGEGFIYPYGPPDGVPGSSGRDSMVPVRVWSGWPDQGGFTLDVHGFSVRDAPTAFTAWYDRDAVVDHYYRECEGFVRAETGAGRAVAFDHNVRFAPRAEEGVWGEHVARPARGAHNDYTDRSGPVRAGEVLGEVPAGRAPGGAVPQVLGLRPRRRREPHRALRLRRSDGPGRIPAAGEHRGQDDRHLAVSRSGPGWAACRTTSRAR